MGHGSRFDPRFTGVFCTEAGAGPNREGVPGGAGGTAS